MKKLKAILSFVFTLGIICLGFSFASNKSNQDKAYAISYTTNEIVDIINAGECVEKGGAIYLSAGSTYNMSGGEVSGHFAEKGGALYISDGAVFTMTGGTITGNYAKYGGAIYVASGGECYINGGTITGNYGMNAPAIYVESGGILEISDDALVDGNIFLEKTTPINVYVDGTLSKTIDVLGKSYTLDEADMPLDYEHCCGYFLDSELRTTIKNDTIDLTSAGEEITFAPRTATASSEGLNIYTRTATDSSYFTFEENTTTGFYDIVGTIIESGDVVLPKEYQGVQVSIGTTDLMYEPGVNKPVFYNKNISSIILPSGLTELINGVFYCCNLIGGELIIPDSVTSIGDFAFYHCRGLTGSLIIPDSVTSIGNYAFDDCSGFTGSLTIPDSVTSIGDSAFHSCSGLTSVTIENGVTSIGVSAFEYCIGLTGELIIPDSVTSIGDGAFQSCSGLTSVTIPNSVTSIGNSAFYFCSGLTGELIIPDSVTSIGDSAFRYCSGLTSVYIPSTVTTITASNYSYAPFYQCSSSLVIYTDVANASSKPSGWSTYWNYYSSSGTLTVNYGYTLEQYKSAVGLTFAPNGEKVNGAEVEVVEEDNAYRLDNSYLNEMLFDKREYIVLPKKQVKIA